VLRRGEETRFFFTVSDRNGFTIYAHFPDFRASLSAAQFRIRMASFPSPPAHLHSAGFKTGAVFVFL